MESARSMEQRAQSTGRSAGLIPIVSPHAPHSSQYSPFSSSHGPARELNRTYAWHGWLNSWLNSWLKSDIYAALTLAVRLAQQYDPRSARSSRRGDGGGRRSDSAGTVTLGITCKDRAAAFEASSAGERHEHGERVRIAMDRIGAAL